MSNTNSLFVRKVAWLWSQEGFQHQPVATIGRLLLWAVAARRKSETLVTIHHLKVQLWLPPQWKGPAKLIYTFRERYEPELAFVCNWLEPGMTVLDAGSLYGLYTVVAATRVGDGGRVISVEPSRGAYAVLTRNIALNNLTNVTAIQFALGLGFERRLLYHHPDPGQNSLAWEAGSTGVEEVDVVSLDELVQQLEIRRLDVFKLDVEGAELPAIKGGDACLKRFRPVIIAEIHPQRSCSLGCKPSDFLEYLSDLGYSIFQYVPTSGRLRTVRSMAELQGPRIVATTGQATKRLLQQGVSLWAL
jgi:FkbM family methyltransferase